MKFDLHIHSMYSSDSKSRPKDIIRYAEKKELDGFAITDHNNLRWWGKIKNVDTPLIMIPGIEISTDKGHMIALGLQEEIEPRSALEETIELIDESHGITIAAHPYRFWSGIGEKAVLDNHWSAIEGLNGRSGHKDNYRARKLAKRMSLPIVGGSDSHNYDTIGKAFTLVEDVSTWEDVISEIQKGKTSVSGDNRDIKETLKYTKKSVSGWLGRGFKRI